MTPPLPRFSFTLSLLLTLAACSGGSGGGGSERPIDLAQPGQASGVFIYDGAAPASDEVQNFKVSFYDSLAGNDRCGECHTPGGSGTTAFVDQTNVNKAWQAARSVINLEDPAASAVVRRVANGHNCWLGTGQWETCATTITGYIERWAAGEREDTSAIALSPRRALSPSGTRVMPVDMDAALSLGVDLTGTGELLDLLQTYCAGCHSDSAAFPQVPYFGSEDATIAYAALRGKVDLVEPATSRVVLRLVPESHNCWSDCDDNAGELIDAIERLTQAIPLTDVDPAMLFSTAQVIEQDGIIATSGGRAESGLIAKWEFREGKGNTTADTSGVAPEIPLTLSGDYSWQAGWGVRFVDGKAQGAVNGSVKLFDKITGTGEYSIEAWVAPANVSQEEAWIVGYAGGPDTRNLLLGQNLYNYEAYNRSTVTDSNNGGAPPLSTSDDAQLAQATLQHVVVTYDPVVGRQLYVNGQFTGDVDPVGGGLLNNWSEAFAVVLGNTTAGTNPWAGTLRMAAVHNVALSPEAVVNNYEVGVGQKYFLMFSVAELLDREGECHVENNDGRTNYCYVVFEVSRFDADSYLFNKPFFVNINPDGGDVSFDLRGVRLGINGKLATTGQAFVNLNERIEGGNLGTGGQALASIGSIIPLENGPERDVFFLAFDDLGGNSGDYDDGRPLGFGQILRGESAPDIAMRTFDEINATLSRLTGVETASPQISAVTGKTVAETFEQVRRALPGVSDLQAYMSSHQMAATQLTAAYCDALVQDTDLRRVFFSANGGFDFSQQVADPAIDWRGQVAAPLVDRAINSGLVSDAIRGRLLAEIEMLITDDRDLKPYIFVNGRYISDPDPAVHDKRDGLIYCKNDRQCPASRTADVVKAACTTVFGSALVLMQ